MSSFAPGFGYGEFLPIKPGSFTETQRKEAVELADKLGAGVRMEVYSGHTEFYADLGVPVSEIDVYCAMSYKAWPVYDGRLMSASDEWAPPRERVDGEET